jgi:RNA polymerase sigma-70 factor (ECF subfamily)
MTQGNGVFNIRVRAAQSGSAEALGDLLEGCRQYLLLVANEELRPDVQAKVAASDLVQDTFVDAHRDFQRFTGRSQDDLLVWLRQILRNNLRDATRSYRAAAKRHVHREIPLPAERDSAAVFLEPLQAAGQSPSWPVRQGEQNEALRRALAQLSDDHRQVIVLRNLELKSFVEIAQRMQRSPDAARKLWGRALQTLAHLLDHTDAHQRHDA